MADFLPPPGPPPPKVPEGWTARWNDQYKEWFYVNVYTKASQWEKPTEPAYPPGEAPPTSPPPGYAPGSAPPPPIDSKAPHPSNPFSPQNTGANSSSRAAQEEADAELARRLQAEEDAQGHRGPSPASGSRGAAASFYDGQGGPGYGGGANNPPPGAYGGYDQNPYGQQPPNDSRDRGKGGLLGKLLGKTKQGRGGGFSGQQGGYGGGGGYPGQQGGYGGGGYPGQYGGGGYPGQYGGGGYPGQYGGGGFPGQQGGMPYGGGSGSGRPAKSGMSAGKGALLGAGAGLVGGALIADVMMHEQEQAYDQGFNAGAADAGGDYGGGDFGGGDDFGGDF